MSLESEMHSLINSIEKEVEKSTRDRIASIEKGMIGLKKNSQEKKSHLIGMRLKNNVPSAEYEDYTFLMSKLKEWDLFSSINHYEGFKSFYLEIGIDKFSIQEDISGFLVGAQRYHDKRRGIKNYRLVLVELLVIHRVGVFIQDLIKDHEKEPEILPAHERYSFDLPLKMILKSNDLHSREQCWVVHFLKETGRLDTSEISSIPIAIDELLERNHNNSDTTEFYYKLEAFFIDAIPNMSNQKWIPTHKSLIKVSKIFQSLDFNDIVGTIDLIIKSRD